jgi:hypothetical protein
LYLFCCIVRLIIYQYSVIQGDVFMDKTIVALYDNVNDARDAVQELVDNGVPRDNISLVASNARGDVGEVRTDTAPGETSGAAEGAGVGAGIGAALGGVGGILVGLGALTIPGIGPVLAAGPLAAALGGVAGAGAGAIAGGAAGGLIGALTDMGVNEDQAGYYAEGVRRGGTLLTIRTDEHMTSRAVDIMDRHHPVDIKERTHSWREQGWSGFDAEDRTLGGDYTRTHDRDVHGDFTHDTPRDHEVEMFDVDRRDDVRDDLTRDTTRDIGTQDVERRGDLHGDFTRDQTDMDMDRGREGSMGMTDTGYTAGAGMGTTGYTGHRTFDLYEEDFRADFDRNYANRGYTYDEYRPAYRYGYDLAADERYRDRQWQEIEPEARRDWERNHPDNAWEDFKHSVRTSWERVKDTFR